MENKTVPKKQINSGGDIGIGLLRQPFVVDELSPTGEHAAYIRAYGY